MKKRIRPTGRFWGILKQALPFLIIAYIANRESWLYRHCVGGSFLSRFTLWSENLTRAFSHPVPSFHPTDLLVGALCGIVSFAVLHELRANQKKYRDGVEYGSARWATHKDILPFLDPDPTQNVILTQTEGLTMKSRPARPEYGRNKNVVVIGGSGSGKTRFFIKPNLMQMHSSYIVTDPKGTLLLECGNMLREHGYTVKIFDTIHFDHSMKYNPFRYIHSEKDILKLVNVIIENTTSEHERSSDGFWVKAERLLYTALIGYIWYECPEEELNFETLLRLLNACDVRENDEEHFDAVDLLFADLERADPEHFSVRQYRRFKQAAGETAKSILISCGARLAPFDIRELRDLMTTDEMHLQDIGRKKTALFIIISDTDTTFNFVVAMMYSQLFNLLCEEADSSPGGRLPFHVRLLLDEFANIGKIPNFEKLIATIRSREISACIVLQSASQLKTLYKDASETILGNCDSHLFLGGKEESTLKQISEALGKETIDVTNSSRTRGSSNTTTASDQLLGKSLMTVDELAVMDGRKCILQLRGVRPFFSDKYDITRHPRYRELSDYDPKNEFDVTSYLARYRSRRLRLPLDESFPLTEVAVKGGEDDEPHP